MSTILSTSVLIGTFCLSWVISGVTYRLLSRYRIFAYPDRRSSHAEPIPQGGGIAVVTAITCGWSMLGIMGIADWPSLSVVLAATLLLAIVSWFDDLGGAPISIRMLAQIIIVATVMLLVPLGVLPQNLLPQLLEFLLIAVLWIWFINLYNFMDGIDGITAVETLCICSGVALVSFITGLGSDLFLAACVVAAAVAGFLPWNWNPAKMFLGDVGSVPIGFIMGWFLLEVSGHGFWVAALILPGYYVSDATLTLLKRLICRKLIWESHREHLYQHAVAGSLTHGQASTAVGITGLWLIGCAILSVTGGSNIMVSIAAAIMGIIALLWYFHSASQTA